MHAADTCPYNHLVYRSRSAQAIRTILEDLMQTHPLDARLDLWLDRVLTRVAG